MTDAADGTARGCGGCTLCCTVMAVTELAKTIDADCAHCVAGEGCGIYETRPGSCRSFRCAWLDEPKFGEKWRPDRSGLIVTLDGFAGAPQLHADSARPDAWRQEPYFSVLMGWARDLNPARQFLTVRARDTSTVIFPDGTWQTLGPVRQGMSVKVDRVGTPFWQVWVARLVESGDAAA